MRRKFGAICASAVVAAVALAGCGTSHNKASASDAMRLAFSYDPGSLDPDVFYDGERLVELLKQHFAPVIGMTLERLDGRQPISSYYDLDSLMRLELVLVIEQQLGVRLEDDALSEGTSFVSLAAEVLRRLSNDPDEDDAVGAEGQDVAVEGILV